MHFSVRLRTSRNVSRPPEPTDRRASRSHSYESLAQLLPAGPRQSDCERVTPQPARSTADTPNARRERFTSPSPRAGPRCRGGRHRGTRQAVRDDLFSAPIDAASPPDGQPSPPWPCPSPNPTPAFGSASVRKLLSSPLPILVVTSFRGFADRSLLARTPTRTRRGPSQPR